ncbi:MAG TPA: DUF420 domain-containing protein [Gammaproteobacteria bacterium]|nr:DUF420 domain-containing protein [Gammaproteobacteria bacterium]
MGTVAYLPHLQALLNATTVSLLIVGYSFIKKKNRFAHKACMIGAALVSAVFMVCYLIYHAKVGNIPFAGEGMIRPFYFSVLATHVILAAINVPLVVITLSYAVRGKFASHRWIARRSLPIWIYVSVTGLLVYLLAFHLYSG